MIDRSLWIFGYGSLIWRPSFDFEERCVAYAAGWARRFWQGSTDHRGTPEAPGRVVTLVPELDARCWGMAYRVAAGARDAVLDELDRREQGGYSRREVQVFLSGREPSPCMASVYVALPDNPNYLGNAAPPDIARQIRDAQGPSGANRDYLLRLADALGEIGTMDEHVLELVRLVAPESVKMEGAVNEA